MATHLVVPAEHCKKEASRMPCYSAHTKAGILLRRKHPEQLSCEAEYVYLMLHRRE